MSFSGPQSEYPSPHKVLIASEEQFKVFLLPNLKPCGKYKLTAHEGARVRKVKAVTFTSTEGPAPHAENCIVFLTNLGEVSILAFPDLKRQVTTAAIRKEDVVGISSLVFSEAGDAVYMSSSSELQLLTVAATIVGLYATNTLKEREIAIATKNNAQSLRNQREESETNLRSAMFRELVGPLLQSEADEAASGNTDLPRAQRLAPAQRIALVAHVAGIHARGDARDVALDQFALAAVAVAGQHQ